MGDIASSKLHLKVVGPVLVHELQYLDRMKVQKEAIVFGDTVAKDLMHPMDKVAEEAVDSICDE